MKTAYVIFILFLFTKAAVAQNLDTVTEKPKQQVALNKSLKKSSLSKWYFTIPSISFGKYSIMPGAGFAYMHKNGWGASFEIKGGQMNSPNVPKDFYSGDNLFLLFTGWGFLMNDGIPNEKSNLLLLSFFKEIPSKKGDFVTTLQGGFSYIEKRYPHKFVYVPDNNRWFTGMDNYTYQFHTTKTMGLYLKPGCKILFNKHVALAASGWAILQPHPTYYGIEMGLQFGNLR